MPKEIKFPNECPHQNNNHLNIPAVSNDKRCSMESNQSQQDFVMEGKWKTNLMISQEQERVNKRDQGYRKNTSFQNKIINDHLWAMVKSVFQLESNLNFKLTLTQCKKICDKICDQQARSKEGIVSEKIEKILNQNVYPGEEQKQQLLKQFSQNYDNYQIVLKTYSRLRGMPFYRDELMFILFELLVYLDESYELNQKKYDQQFMEQEVAKNLGTITQKILTHQNVMIINPVYFYNENQKSYMKIIKVWFECVFSIKLGISQSKYLDQTQILQNDQQSQKIGIEMDFE